MDPSGRMDSILVVDDDEVTRNLLKEVLEKEKYTVATALSGEEAVRALKKQSFSLVISDIRMLELDGMAVLRETKRLHPDAVVVLMTGFGSMEGAVSAIQAGAYDYISKPFRINDLRQLVTRALRHGQTSKEQSGSGKKNSTVAQEAPRAVIGKSPKIVEIYKTLARAAMSSSTVLIRGEGGTGKETIARAIHDHSPRRDKPFIAVNCGAFPEPQLEKELFGSDGVLVEAEGGTVFLDEVSDLGPSLQARLLRYLELGEFKPIGAENSRKSDVRICAATHRDLDAIVRAEKFREDLYYRLRVISMDVPPLRDRMEDLPELVGYFLARHASRSEKQISHVSDEAFRILKNSSWPGNVRELEHVIERAVALCRGTVIEPEDISNLSAPGAHDGSWSSAIAASGSTGQVASGGTQLSGGGAATGASLDELERQHILKVLKETAYNKSKAADILGIDRATLYRKAAKYGIDLRGK